MPTNPGPDQQNEAAASSPQEPPLLHLDAISESLDVRTRPLHEITATALASASLGIFGLTVLIPIIVGTCFHPISANIIDLVERLVSIEIGPLGVIFGFYFSDKIRRD